jgi:hypothetical protein
METQHGDFALTKEEYKALARANQALLHNAQRVLTSTDHLDDELQALLSNICQTTLVARRDLKTWSKVGAHPGGPGDLRSRGMARIDTFDSDDMPPRPNGASSTDRSRSLFWLVAGVSGLIILGQLAFAIAATRPDGYVGVSSALCIDIVAIILTFLVPAAAFPTGPPPEMSALTNSYFAFLAAIAYHSLVVKWIVTEELGHSSRLIRRALVVGITITITLTAICQWALGRNHFWRIVRLSAATTGVIRLHAIALLYLDGESTTYPPGALPLSRAVAVVSLTPACSIIATPTVRQHIARSAGIAERIRRLRRKCVSFLGYA